MIITEVVEFDEELYQKNIQENTFVDEYGKGEDQDDDH